MKKILYLDADLLNKSIFDSLVSGNFEEIDVTALSSTSSGEDALRNNSYDMIVSQIYPERLIDGLNLVKNLRLGRYGNSNRNIWAIAYTTINLVDTPQECIEAGFDTFVPMPDTEHRLLVEIQRLLNIKSLNEKDVNVSTKVSCLNLESSDVDKDLIRCLLKKEFGNKIFLFQASSLAAAEEILKNRKIDFAICDGPGAATFAQNLRDGIYGQNLTTMTTIVCTGYANIGAKEDYLRLGFSAYIPKPIIKKELIKTISDLIPLLSD